MDLISDHFISYDEDFTVKQEKASDPEVSFTLPFSLASDSTSFYPSFINPSLRNMLENSDLTIKQSIHIEEKQTLKRSKPFKIIKPKRESLNDPIEVKIEPEKKIITNSRREYRREVAKKKCQRKKEAKSFLSTYGANLTPEGLSNLNVDEKTGKKLLQMIRNRISAQNSRDRRKTYLQTLEHAKDVLLHENNHLSEEKNDLFEEVKRLRETNMRLLKEREVLTNLGKKQKDAPLFGGVLNNCLANLELPSADSSANKKGLALSFQVALVLSVLILTRMNQQGGAQQDPFSEQNQAKLFMPVDDNSDFLFVEKNDSSVNFLRKTSHSTTFSSQGSPLPQHNPLEKSFKVPYCSNGSDDELTTNINSPLQEDKLKDFDLMGENLLMNLHGYKTMKVQGNQVGNSIAGENNIFSKETGRMEGCRYF